MDDRVSEGSRPNQQATAAAVSVAAENAAANEATSVKLLIKSSNQQYDDQIIESDVMWTIKRLKLQLSVVYPSKPPVAEQKLIYSGQLLNDKLLLKNVLRSYKDVYTHNHIIHLVYTPRVAPAAQASKTDLKKKSTSNMTTSGGGVATVASGSSAALRQRYVVSAAENQTSQQQQPTQQQQQQQPLFHAQYFPQMAGGSMFCPPLTTGQDALSMSAQVMATHLMARQQTAMNQWMQQVYSQYMEQCSRLFSSNGETVAPNGDNIVPNVSAGFWSPNPFMPYVTQPGSSLGSAYYPAMPQQAATQNVAATEPTVLADAPGAAAAAAAVGVAEEPRDEGGAAAEPRFPLIAQDEIDNHDWLDSFFSITRLAVFLTILYFNSSPMRCLIVLIIATVIYLYHIGVLRINRERNNNNNNNNNRNNNNNNNANNANEQVRQGVQQVQRQQQQNEDESASSEGEDVDDTATTREQDQIPTAEGVNTTNNNESDVIASNDAETNSMLYTLRNFVITFFTSLLPETPAV